MDFYSDSTLSNIKKDCVSYKCSNFQLLSLLVNYSLFGYLFSRRFCTYQCLIKNMICIMIINSKFRNFFLFSFVISESGIQQIYVIAFTGLEYYSNKRQLHTIESKKKENTQKLIFEINSKSKIFYFNKLNQIKIS